jgi:hypothetical protein
MNLKHTGLWTVINKNITAHECGAVFTGTYKECEEFIERCSNTNLSIIEDLEVEL